MVGLEDQLLTQLASDSGVPILEDHRLIQSLESTKHSSTEVKVSLEKAAVLKDKLDREREMFRPIAALGAKVYMFLSSTLPLLNGMYRFSLSAYIKLFRATLQAVSPQIGLLGPADDYGPKLSALELDLKGRVTHHVSQSLFKNDRLTFSVYLARVVCAPGTIGKNEWDLLCGAFVPAAQPSPPPLAWVPEHGQMAMALLRQALPSADSAWQLNRADIWGQWLKSLACSPSVPPVPVQNMTPFQRALLIKALCPEKLDLELTAFACEVLGVSSLSAATSTSLRALVDEGPEPVLFVVTSGADPSAELEQLAQGAGVELRALAMGATLAEDVQLTAASPPGGAEVWYLLKNIHLAIASVPALEKKVRALPPGVRVWMTTEVHELFPPVMLETCRKIVYEAPPGVRQNIARTLEGWGDGRFGQGSMTCTQLYFVTAHFHAVAQERRMYVPQGWSKFYEFNSSDLLSAVETVGGLVKAGARVDWQTLRGVLQEAVYGSRLDNVFDQRLMTLLINGMFSEEVLASSHGSLARAPSAPQWMLKLRVPPFSLPPTQAVADYLSELSRSLPEQEGPELLGMSANADRASHTSMASALCQRLKSLTVAGGAVDMNKQGERGWALGPLLSFTSLLTVWPEGTRSVRQPLPADSPMTSFILLEAALAASLCNLVGSHLASLRKVHEDQAESTPELNAVVRSLVKDQVPDCWSNAWPEGPDEPMAFVQGLQWRAAALQGKWMQHVAQGHALSEVDLSELLRPRVFLNALRQHTSRLLAGEGGVDSLSLHSGLGAGAGANSIKLSRLMLEGSDFDQNKNMVITCTLTSPLLVPLPVVWVEWSPRPPVEPPGCLRVPLYSDPLRVHLLCELTLPVDCAELRVLNSVAVMTNRGH